MTATIFENDDTNLVRVLAVYPYWGAPTSQTNNLSQTVTITAVSGSNITIWPPLVWSFTNTLNPSITFIYPLIGDGIEDMTVQHLNPQTGAIGGAISTVYLTYASGCWLRNVESAHVSGYHFQMDADTLCEIRECYAHEAPAYGPGEGVGLLFYVKTCSTLVEDNMFYCCAPSMEINNGSSGNAFLYNYSYQTLSAVNTNAQRTSPIFLDYDINHGPHNMMNLWEGNVGTGMQSDGWFGSTSHQTIFRNYFSGVHPLSRVYLRAIDLCIWTYYCSIVGNVLGSPSYTNLFGDVLAAPGAVHKLEPDQQLFLQSVGALSLRLSANGRQLL